MNATQLEKIVGNALEDIKGRDIEVINTAKLTQLFEGIVVARPDLGPWKAAMGPAWDKVKVRVRAGNYKGSMDMVVMNSR